MLSIFMVFVSRVLLILLFLPFSALDKILNFKQATAQAEETTSVRAFAIILISGGFAIEVIMSLAILTGIADRFSAFILAGYCLVTALLWKRFWKRADFRLVGKSEGREVFWDFLKNVALAGGFLLLAFGTTTSAARIFVAHPFASSHPYETSRIEAIP